MTTRRASYHNHTVFSDGADTPDAFLALAKTQGISILGFADHYYQETATSTTAPEWALQPHLYNCYFDTVAALKSQKEIEIRTGLEFDWLDNSAPWLGPVSHDKRLDYTIGSVHYVGSDSIDSTRNFWDAKNTDERDDIICAYWKAVKEMAQSHLFDIVGHIDLIKKFDIYPSIDVTALVREALDAIKEADMTVELNTSGWNKDCHECYPSEAILRACFHREIPVVISTDAHRARFVGANYSRALELLARIGYTRLAQFRQRERTFEQIEF